MGIGGLFSEIVKEAALHWRLDILKACIYFG